MTTTPPATAADPSPPVPSKTATVIAMLQRADGASVGLPKTCHSLSTTVTHP
ncbi:MAG: hypothetical protein ACOYLK_07220 [Sphingomonas sp.]